MPHEYLSDEQVGRYGRFVVDPTPEELEKFFFLDGKALELAREKRRLHNRLGWSIQWGTVRMLGTFLTDSGPDAVPEVVVRYVAEQLGIEDWSSVKLYGDRQQTPYEHAWQIRDSLEYREFADIEAEIADFIASRVRKTRDSRRELFDRAVLWLIENQVLLPGITTLSRLVTEIRRIELSAINKVLTEAAPVHMRRELVGALAVPDGKKVSTLEWMRTAVTRLSGTGMSDALDRAAYVLGLGTGAVDCSAVAPVKLAELARRGMTAKAPKIKALEANRRVATLLATVRELEGTSVDDALLLFDLLMSTVLLSRASRAGDKEKLKNLPRLRIAAARLAAAWTIVMDTPQTQAEDDGGEKVTTAAEVLDHVEQVVTREQLAAAVETVLELTPLSSTEDDGYLEWRVELVDRYGTVRPFVDMLASLIPWGCTAAGSQIVAALKALPKLMAARKPGTEHIKGFEDLVTGSWRRLVFGNPNLDPPLIDRPAYTFCILEALHGALRRRDVYAVGADKWGNPRAALIEERLWVRERATVLTALGLDAEPTAHLRELAGVLDDAYKQVAAGLAANPSVSVKGGKLQMSRLEAAPEPEGFAAVHDAVAGMLPRIDYPELLLEVHGQTGMFDGFEHISGSHVRREDLDITLAALTVARSCNVGLVPVTKAGVAALTQHRLIGVEKGYFHGEGIAAASARLVDSQARIDITADWGGGLVASADGMRFVVPVRSLYARPSPLYFGRGKRSRGATWLNVVSDKVMGLGGLVVPGTLRDSLFILDAIHRLDATEQPEIIITDTGSYSDIVYGMFAVCGYQFAPRHADISDTQLWWIDTAMLEGTLTKGTKQTNGWGDFNTLGLRRVSLPAILSQWDDMVRVAGSLSTNQVRAHDLIRMMTADGRLTGLGNAFAHYGRIFKTLHLLQVLHVEEYRRMIGAQLNIGESRHFLARRVFFGNLGRLIRGYARGMEDQVGALGLGLNAITWWNSLYIDAAVKKLEAGGLGISPAIRARLSPLLFEHINFHGFYPFNRPDLGGRLRELRDPKAADKEE
ncbi:Tn3 family transposase [Streptosporangium lutulentum]|uniref:TnpA family transposase n=1 Tax=Streptosporangium lutulentum TaxID=1461250 RepID=A0ABT9Q9F1_9ACTN|nr:Tn3 family transposase [Streptosporangium lutulentum]MDP9843371.1 TnpA family transposase [Streptosporangium lutulentum]